MPKTISETEIALLKTHSAMLGQIANLVEDFCPNGETTTYEAVKYLLSEYYSNKSKLLIAEIERSN